MSTVNGSTSFAMSRRGAIFNGVTDVFGLCEAVVKVGGVSRRVCVCLELQWC